MEDLSSRGGIVCPVCRTPQTQGPLPNSASYRRNKKFLYGCRWLSLSKFLSSGLESLAIERQNHELFQRLTLASLELTSWACHIAVKLQQKFLNFLSFRFSSAKYRCVCCLPHRVVVKAKWDNLYKVLSTIPVMYVVSVQ